MHREGLRSHASCILYVYTYTTYTYSLGALAIADGIRNNTALLSLELGFNPMCICADLPRAISISAEEGDRSVDGWMGGWVDGYVRGVFS